jgi:hypothetical protein
MYILYGKPQRVNIFSITLIERSIPKPKKIQTNFKWKTVNEKLYF